MLEHKSKYFILITDVIFKTNRSKIAIYDGGYIITRFTVQII
jgi:hypothetical protein